MGVKSAVAKLVPEPAESLFVTLNGYAVGQLVAVVCIHLCRAFPPFPPPGDLMWCLPTYLFLPFCTYTKCIIIRMYPSMHSLFHAMHTCYAYSTHIPIHTYIHTYIHTHTHSLSSSVHIVQLFILHKVVLVTFTSLSLAISLVRALCMKIQVLILDTYMPPQARNVSTKSRQLSA